MVDPILESFLSDQMKLGFELAANSDILTLEPIETPSGPPRHWVARFACTGVLWHEDGSIAPEESEFVVGITFAQDHLRYVDPQRIVTWLRPWNILHPNVSPPFVCPGRVTAGITLVDLCYQVFDMISFNNFAPGDALSSLGAQWARQSQHLLPVDKRALRRHRRRRNTPRSSGGDS